MRRLVTIGLTLAGTALAAPLETRAQAPGCATCGDAAAPVMVGEHHHHGRGPGSRKYCPRCQLDQAQREAGGPIHVINGGPDGLPPGVVAEAPGVAQLGFGPNVTPISTEPVPIGVVRAGFHTPPPPGAPGFDPTHGMPAGLGMGMMGAPGGLPVSPSPAWAPPRHRRPSVIGHLLGLNGWRERRREREDRAASLHAAIPLGQPGHGVSGIAPATDLPASMVYGSK